MKSSYIKALETQAAWYQWGKQSVRAIQDMGISSRLVDRLTDTDMKRVAAAAGYDTLISYTEVLSSAETIFMNRNFCDMVDFARLSVPDELQFEEEWMLTPVGFLFLEDSFSVPRPNIEFDWDLRKLGNKPEPEMKIAAVSWARTSVGSYYFMCYQNMADYGDRLGFQPWSHFTLSPGDKVLDRLLRFEGDSRRRGEDGIYPENRTTELKHEIRWVFTALHLMSQRLAHISTERASSLVRNMASRKRLQINPSLKIVSLRRLEQERPKGESQNVDWNWQWVVRGHWRLQPYKTEGDYKWIFIEAYVKGPDGKPLKPFGRTIFKAER